MHAIQHDRLRERREETRHFPAPAERKQAMEMTTFSTLSFSSSLYLHQNVTTFQCGSSSSLYQSMNDFRSSFFFSTRFFSAFSCLSPNLMSSFATFTKVWSSYLPNCYNSSMQQALHARTRQGAASCTRPSGPSSPAPHTLSCSASRDKGSSAAPCGHHQ